MAGVSRAACDRCLHLGSVYENMKLDALIFEAERAVNLLHERRAAMISAAVTGQIDVRGIVAAVKAA